MVEQCCELRVRIARYDRFGATSIRVKSESIRTIALADIMQAAWLIADR